MPSTLNTNKLSTPASIIDSTNASDKEFPSSATQIELTAYKETSSGIVYSGALAEVITCETFYELNNSLWALSYKELIRRWAKALILIHSVGLTGKNMEETHKSLSQVQPEFNEHEKDMVRIIGQDAYSHMHHKFVTAIATQQQFPSIDDSSVPS
ncbi:hypothetical protein HYDPIDRAFT_31369 [Hydnomerulius pinastri MD-312]|uniref:Uncharacterized protein n=1 Tax=Hydnomerulius pinastri MD-312 TaxID=994086 RepID=A0A0C9VU10_9AGAM|nr:hypothetical protein HYDPIDRAFT_31369 [Hydnomerulius pinastri MD-312]